MQSKSASDDSRGEEVDVDDGSEICSVGHASVRAHSQHCDVRTAASAASNRRNLMHERGSARSLGHYSEKSTPPDNYPQGTSGPDHAAGVPRFTNM